MSYSLCQSFPVLRLCVLLWVVSLTPWHLALVLAEPSLGVEDGGLLTSQQSWGTIPQTSVEESTVGGVRETIMVSEPLVETK